MARTQARKDQLVKKREELEACRAKRNSPIKDRTRRPLSEDNNGTAEINTDEIKRRRIGSDDSGKSSALRNPRDIDANSPSVQVSLTNIKIMPKENLHVSFLQLWFLMMVFFGRLVKKGL